MPYVAIQSKDDASAPHGIRSYAKNGFLGSLTNDGIDLIMDVLARTPGLYDIFCDHCGGAYSRTAPDATAFPRRDMQFVLAIWSGWKTSGRRRRESGENARRLEELEPLTQGFYTNYTGSDIVAAGQRENFGAISSASSRSRRSTTR